MARETATMPFSSRGTSRMRIPAPSESSGPAVTWMFRVGRSGCNRRQTHVGRLAHAVGHPIRAPAAAFRQSNPPIAHAWDRRCAGPARSRARREATAVCGRSEAASRTERDAARKRHTSGRRLDRRQQTMSRPYRDCHPRRGAKHNSHRCGALRQTGAARFDQLANASMSASCLRFQSISGQMRAASVRSAFPCCTSCGCHRARSQYEISVSRAKYSTGLSA